MYSWVDSGEFNYAYLLINGGQQVYESRHGTSSETGIVRSTSGREVIREFSQGNTIELRAYRMEGVYYHINYCAEYNPKM